MERNNRAESKWIHPAIIEEHLDSLGDTQAMYEGLEELSAEEIDRKQKENSDAMYQAFDQFGGEEWIQWKAAGENTEYYTEHGCPEESDAKPVRIVVRKPKDIRKNEKLPVVFTVAGGGLVGAGTAEMGEVYGAFHCMWPKKIRAVTVCFNYRLAPAHKYPAAVNDCHAAYLWMLEHAEELQIDTDKIVILGGSSGGHLALCTAFRLKRYNWCGGPMPRGVVVIVPVMDDIAFTNSFTISFENKAGVITNWAAESIEKTMRMWLGDRFRDPFLGPEAVPARATLQDIKGYPPVWIPVTSEMEPSRDSVIKFASLLYEAGIFCDLHIWGGGQHSIANVGETDYGKRVAAIRAGAVKDAIENDFRRPWLER